MWFIIFRYAKHPALLGIELVNEPSAGEVPLDTLVSYYKQGYQIVRKYSSTAYVIICQRIGNADPFELYQANVGSYNLVVDLHYYNLFNDFFVNMSSVENIQYIHKNRQDQLQALNSANGPLVFIGKSRIHSNFRYFFCFSSRVCLFVPFLFLYRKMLKISYFGLEWYMHA